MGPDIPHVGTCPKGFMNGTRNNESLATWLRGHVAMWRRCYVAPLGPVGSCWRPFHIDLRYGSSELLPGLSHSLLKLSKDLLYEQLHLLSRVPLTLSFGPCFIVLGLRSGPDLLPKVQNVSANAP